MGDHLGTILIHGSGGVWLLPQLVRKQSSFTEKRSLEHYRFQFSSTFIPVRVYSLITHRLICIVDQSTAWSWSKTLLWTTYSGESLVEKLFYFSISKQTFPSELGKNCKHFDQILMDFYELLRAQTFFRLSFPSFSPLSAVFILHFTASLQSPFCISPLAYILPFACSLHFTPGPQSAVGSLQSTSYTDHICICCERFVFAVVGL